MKRLTQLSAAALLLAIFLLPGLASADTEPPAGSTYEIVLQSRAFTPAPGSSVQRSAARPEARWHGIIQLQAAPDPAVLAQLNGAGIILHHYIPDNAWLATLPGDAANLPSRMSSVRWVGELTPADKVDRNLHNPGFVDEIAVDGQLALWIQLFPDADWRETLNRLALLGAVSEADATVRQLVLTTTPATLWQVAADDSVAWVLDARTDQATTADSSRTASGADVVQAAPYNLTGAGAQVGIWDNGHAAPHPDFDTRLTNVGTSSVATHATNVTGIVGGSGAGSVAAGYPEGRFTGYAYGAELFVHYFSSPIPAHDPAINTYGIDVSQNSWGYTSCSIFGAYSIYAADYDDITNGRYGNQIPIVFSAGNTNGSCGYTYNSVMGGPSSAKNVIVVGATDDSGSAMAGFSSWGPTDDGRIKPELVAVGTSVAATCNETGYCSYNGTSQAAPAVSGAVALLLEQYQNVCTADGAPLPSTYRGLLVHTANDLADSSAHLNPGPDFASGFGALNVHAAVDTLPYHREGSLSDSVTDSYTIVVSGQSSLKVTLAWDDAPAAYNAAIALINNLDLELVAPDGTVHGPWLLNPAVGHEADPATRPTWKADGTPQRDDRNVIEQVVVDAPQDGTWTVRVIGSSVPVGPQSYTLISEQLDAGQVSCPGGIVVAPQTPVVSAARSGSDVLLSWIHSSNNSAYEVWVNDSATIDPDAGAGTLLATVDGGGLADGAPLSYSDAGIIDGSLNSRYYGVRALNSAGTPSPVAPLVAKVDQSLVYGGAAWVHIALDGVAGTAAALQAHIEANSWTATTVSHIERYVESAGIFNLFAAQPFTFGDFVPSQGDSYRVVLAADGQAGVPVVWTQVGGVPAGGGITPQSTFETGLVDNFRYGQISTQPAAANYLAWIAGSGAPAEVLTDNAFNAVDGPGLGYQNGYWLINLGNLSTTPDSGDTLEMVFAGQEDAAGTIWNYATTLDGSIDHGTVGATTTATCPTVQGINQSGSTRTIYWTGDDGYYNIYRADTGSGVADYSNGRFSHVATVYTAGGNHSYVDAGSGQAWYLVVSADAGGAITGCRSSEVGVTIPTAITFAGIEMVPAAGRLTLILFISGFLAAGTLLLVARATRRRPAAGNRSSIA